MNLEAHVLRFAGEAASEVATPVYKGSMMRGALLAALRRDFCLDREGPRCATAEVRQACPVCSLLVTADEEGARGVEVARPCTVEPPLEERRLYGGGDSFSFGVSLFGDAAELLPYVIIAARRMGETGIGDRRRAPGRFHVRGIEAVDPIAGARQELYRDGEGLVRRAEIVVTHELILERAGRCAATGVTLELLTPMRLVSGGTLVKRITFPVFMRRLLRRLTDLTRTATGSPPGFAHEELLRRAAGVEVSEDRTRWVDVASYSSRQGRSTPIGGLVGEVTFAGELGLFVPWLLWGSVTHVGKGATKGGGWYRLRWPS